MLIDFHTHAFPDPVAGKALKKLSFAGAGLTPCADGTIDALVRSLEAVDAIGVLLPIATNPHKLRGINDWAYSHASNRVIPFGSIHPDAPDAFEELERIASLGMRGIKFHPEYQGFSVDEPRMLPIYKKIGSLGLICVFHTGWDVAYMPPARCSPEALASVLDAFDGAPVVAAHFGGLMMWDSVLKSLAGREVYLDTAYSHGLLVKPLAEKIVEKHGADKILFGSDSPWSDIGKERDTIATLSLSPSEREAIFSGNAARLLNLDNR